MTSAQAKGRASWNYWQTQLHTSLNNVIHEYDNDEPKQQILE